MNGVEAYERACALLGDDVRTSYEEQYGPGPTKDSVAILRVFTVGRLKDGHTMEVVGVGGTWGEAIESARRNEPKQRTR